jgi:hypothetical protein
MNLESDAEPIFATILVGTQQLHIAKAFLARDGRPKNLAVGLFQGRV